MSDLIDVDVQKKYLREIARERDWDQFHNPKNLVMAISGECGELSEIFQWLSPDQIENLEEKKIEHAGEELSDIIIYCIRLADKLGVNLAEAIERKKKINEKKYPVEKSKGLAKKYTEF